MDALEQKAIELIERAGDRGVLQSELWKKLGINSREGSRVVAKLQRRGLIKREPAVFQGKRTFRIVSAKRQMPKVTVTIDSVKGIPCFSCPDIERCGVGQPISPVTCPKLNKYLMEEIAKLESSAMG